MSRRVREWLARLNLLSETTYKDRKEIDGEIERRTNLYCDDAIEEGLVTQAEFLEKVNMVLKRKKKKAMEIVV